jgi:hypothetical protein
MRKIKKKENKLGLSCAKLRSNSANQRGQLRVSLNAAILKFQVWLSLVANWLRKKLSCVGRAAAAYTLAAAAYTHAAAAYTQSAAAYTLAAAAYTHAAAAYMHQCENKAYSDQLELGFGLSLSIVCEDSWYQIQKLLE